MHSKLLLFDCGVTKQHTPRLTDVCRVFLNDLLSFAAFPPGSPTITDRGAFAVTHTACSKTVRQMKPNCSPQAMLPPSMSPAARKPLQTFLRFLHKETFAFVGREHRKGTISNHTWFLWRRGRLQRWDFSSNEGRLPGAGV